mmetsp:Transcript_3229/g.8709  ORF Transcript_3229/g.8709 Transcript_3229/m.8709 type:complete len:323 (-) Transcript_3229:243-1211(-)
MRSRNEGRLELVGDKSRRVFVALDRSIATTANRRLGVTHQLDADGPVPRSVQIQEQHALPLPQDHPPVHDGDRLAARSRQYAQQVRVRVDRFLVPPGLQLDRIVDVPAVLPAPLSLLAVDVVAGGAVAVAVPERTQVYVVVLVRDVLPGGGRDAPLVGWDQRQQGVGDVVRQPGLPLVDREARRGVPADDGHQTVRHAGGVEQPSKRRREVLHGDRLTRDRIGFARGDVHLVVHADRRPERRRARRRRDLVGLGLGVRVRVCRCRRRCRRIRARKDAADAKVPAVPSRGDRSHPKRRREDIDAHQQRGCDENRDRVHSSGSR